MKKLLMLITLLVVLSGTLSGCIVDDDRYRNGYGYNETVILEPEDGYWRDGHYHHYDRHYHYYH